MYDLTCIPFGDQAPSIDSRAFVAPGARLIGAVTLDAESSIWFNAVLRADLAAIRVGRGSSIQDCCVVHVDHDGPCEIGTNVVVGHNAVLHACRIGDGALVGMGAVVLSGVEVGAGAVVAAGSLVKEGCRIPPRTLYAGSPARCVRSLDQKTSARILAGARVYRDLLPHYRSILGMPAPETDSGGDIV